MKDEGCTIEAFMIQEKMRGMLYSMNEHQISLPNSVYENLLAVAAMQGVTPADWIAAQLPTVAEQQKSLPDLLYGLVGAINSQEEPRQSY